MNMSNFKSNFFILILFLSSFYQSIFAQSGTGKIGGKILDASTGEALIGAVVQVEGTNKGAAADLDGNFVITGLNPGSYNIIISSMGYTKKIHKDVKVKAGQLTTLNISMESSAQELNEVVVTGEAKKESINAILIQQKNAAAISNGISAETIKTSPDRNTGEVLKRISGASIQDNKFAIIRGLNDRYNTAMINGAPMPSSEPDRRAFSFDLFPSNMLDNLIINKAATPDMPGDFAGGVIQLNTRDIPAESFISATIGATSNSVSTGKEYYTYQNPGNNNFLGYDNGSRNLPGNFPSDRTALKKLKPAERFEFAKSLPNNWAPIFNESALPMTNFQLAGGLRTKIFKNDFGAIFSTTYSNARRFNEIERGFYDVDNTRMINFTDRQYKQSFSSGALLNLTYTIGESHKFSFKNSVSLNADDQFTKREGTDIANTMDRLSYNYNYTSNYLQLSQFSGTHYLPFRKIKLDWNTSYGKIKRNMPDLRNIAFGKPSDDTTIPYQVAIAAQPSLQDGGRFYSTLNENNYSAGYNFTVPFDLFDEKSSLKVGGYHLLKDRNFSARTLGIVSENDEWDYWLTYSKIDTIFNPNHFRKNGFTIDDITNPTDKYSANSKLHSGYVMLDNKFSKKLRAIWGVRYENQTQNLNTFLNSGAPKVLTKNFADFLPSTNLIYSLTEKSNLRFSASQTVSRPEFRELSPFSFYDFSQFSITVGNDKLNRAKITNLDLRYELYPGLNETFSVSAFYKDFKDPIEQTLAPTSNIGTFERTFRNVDRAKNFGAELEFRKSLGFISKKFFPDLTVFTNLAYIKSNVEFKNNDYTYSRPLQGQSPYIINAGLQYFNEKNGFRVSALVNRIGRRISDVGTTDFLDVYENPRTIVDLQISKTFFKKLEVRIGTADYLGKDVVYYQDVNANGKYDAQGDNLMTRKVVGRNFNAGLSVKF